MMKCRACGGQGYIALPSEYAEEMPSNRGFFFGPLPHEAGVGPVILESDMPFTQEDVDMLRAIPDGVMDEHWTGGYGSINDGARFKALIAKIAARI